VDTAAQIVKIRSQRRRALLLSALAGARAFLLLMISTVSVMGLLSWLAGRLDWRVAATYFYLFNLVSLSGQNFSLHLPFLGGLVIVAWVLYLEGRRAERLNGGRPLLNALGLSFGYAAASLLPVPFLESHGYAPSLVSTLVLTLVWGFGFGFWGAREEERVAAGRPLSVLEAGTRAALTTWGSATLVVGALLVLGAGALEAAKPVMAGVIFPVPGREWPLAAAQWLVLLPYVIVCILMFAFGAPIGGTGSVADLGTGAATFGLLSGGRAPLVLYGLLIVPVLLSLVGGLRAARLAGRDGVRSAGAGDGRLTKPLALGAAYSGVPVLVAGVTGILGQLQSRGLTDGVPGAVSLGVVDWRWAVLWTFVWSWVFGTGGALLGWRSLRLRRQR